MCDEEVRFLLIAIWPGSLKSETISQSWQPWMIGKNDAWWSSVVSASNATDLSIRDAYKSMLIMQSDWYKAVFPKFGVDKKTQKKKKWQQERQGDWITPGGAFRQAISIDTQTTGKGAPHLLWDDIISAKDGDSETIRNKTNNWLGETFRSRLRDQVKGTITGVMQRLHELDPIGYQMEEKLRDGATPYKLIEIPLEAKRPQAYSYRSFRHLRRGNTVAHPERFPPTVIKQLQTSMRINYDGQYNQRPTKLEGRMLKPHKFILSDKPPEQVARELNLRVCIYGDLAVKEKEVEKDDPDYSVWVVMARDTLQRKWLLDVWREQGDLNNAADAMLAMYDKWHRITGVRPQVKAEKGVIEHSYKAVIKNVCQLRKRGLVLPIGLSIPGDKIQRAAPLQACIDSNQFCTFANVTWKFALESEFRHFPRGAHDDQVDAVDMGVEDLEGVPTGEDYPYAAENAPDGQITGDMLRDVAKRKQRIRDASGR